MTDRVGLTGMVFYAYHGVRAEERALGQRFVVDVELERSLAAAGRSDRLEDSVDYAAVYRIARDVVEGPPRSLLERLAEELAQRLLAELTVEVVRVRVHKPQAPLEGAVAGEAWVEVERRQRP